MEVKMANPLRVPVERQASVAAPRLIAPTRVVSGISVTVPAISVPLPHY